MKGSILILSTHELLNKIKLKLTDLNTTNEEWITDACDEILRKLTFPLNLLRRKITQRMIQHNGYQLLLQVLVKISDNDDLFLIIVIILTHSLRNPNFNIII